MFKSLGVRMRALFRKEALDRDLDEEIGFHLEMEAQKHVARGQDPEEARWAALRSFGGVEQVKERCKEARGVGLLETLIGDLRIGARMLMKRPGFTAMALVVLGLGLGANTAIFSVVRGVLLRPLPYSEGDRIVVLRQQQPLSGVNDMGFSPTEIADYRSQSQSLDAVVEYHSMNFTLLGRAEPSRVRTGVVSAEFFDVLGVRPLLGRAFLPGEDKQGADAVLVLSHGYWQRAFDGDPQVVGKTVEMNDRIHTVVGVLPPIPQYPAENDVYMPTSHCPFRSRERVETDREARMVAALGRLRPEVGIEQARADLAAVAGRLQAQHPGAYPKENGYAVEAVTLEEELTRSFRPTLLVLLATAGFVLLIVCANVANLTLARLSQRERELAIRAALGAGRGRLARQLLTEHALLAFAGGAIGLLIAYGGLDLLVSFASRFTTRAAEIRIDGVVLLFTLGISTCTGLAFGALPALSRRDLSAALKDGGDRSGSGPARQRGRNVLLVTQLAFSFVLLIGAGLMVRSLINLHRVDPGFDPENVLTMQLDLNWSKYTTPESRSGFFVPLLEGVAALPGVRSAAATAAIPLNETWRWRQELVIESQPAATGQAAPQADFAIASEDYFRTIGTPLLRGRSFTEADAAGAPRVVVINESMARHRFESAEAVGQRISMDAGETWATVVGVVGDVRQYGLDVAPGDSVYMPLRQHPGLSMGLLVRSTSDPAGLVQQIRALIRTQDPQQPIAGVQSLEQVRDNSMAAPRVTAWLLSLFAGLALVITAAGLSSMLALQVSRRTRELAVRMALGATRGQILRTVMSGVLGPVLAGLGLGMLGAIGLTGLMSGLLFGIEPTDPSTFLGVAGVLLAAATAAGLVPARRATSIEPMEALRSD